MAKRLNPRHQESVRAKIQASQLINRLQNHANGKNKMTATQIRAAEILLSKSVSNAPVVTAEVDAADIPDFIIRHGDD